MAKASRFSPSARLPRPWLQSRDVPIMCVIGVALFGAAVFLSLWRVPPNSYDS